MTTEQLIVSGYEARRAGQLDEAKRLFSEALERCADGGDERARAQSLTGLGQMERDLGNRPTAISCYKAAAEIYRTLTNPLRLAHTLRHVGDMLREDGAIEEASKFYEEALAIYREQGDRSDLDLANMLRGFALLESRGGKGERAKSFWQEAKQLYEAAGVQLGIDMRPGIEECETHLQALERKDA